MCAVRVSHFAFFLSLAFIAAAPSPDAPPRIFFIDLESGPKDGGEGNAGAFVTVYGRGFGAARGSSSVTVGGGLVSAYRSWTPTKVVIQLGAAAVTGDVVLVTAAGRSNGIPFVVRKGNIYFVAATGNDAADGRFSTPWRSLMKARDSMAPGDITYARDGVTQSTDDGQGWNAALTLRAGACGGQSPRALVAYPGAVVSIGGSRAPANGIRGVDSSAGGGACSGSWVFAGLVIRAPGAVNIWGPSSNWRFVGNDISCPEGDGASGCFHAAQAVRIKLLGNRIHDAGRAGSSALYQGVYLGSDSNYAEIGWNTIENVRGCRGIQVYSHPLGSFAPDSGRNQYGIAIHDNVIHDTQCDAILLHTIDPSRGSIDVYNNVIFNAGLGNTPERRGNWSCINVVGETNYGAPGGGVVEVYQNTLHNCGANAAPPYPRAVNAIQFGGRNPALYIHLRNNLVMQKGSPYFNNFGPPSAIRGSNNLFFGSGPLPSGASLSKSVQADPAFLNLKQSDFRLSSASPARGAGVETPCNADKSGLPRGGAAGYDIGAYQYVAPAALQ